MRVFPFTLFLLTLIFSGSMFANVGVFAGSGHSILLTKTEDIAMMKEVITILPGRGPHLFDGGVPGMDVVRFECRFKLKNLGQERVDIQVGFPLDTQFLEPPYGNDADTIDLVARYNFIAQEKGAIYDLRYVPGDQEGKLANLFLWDMTFGPEEEKDLVVTYSMPISMTLYSSAKKRQKYAKKWSGNLENCMLEYFSYVTETGKSWAGPIREAEFRVHLGGFEAYLRRRPLMEGMSEDEWKELGDDFPVHRPTTVRLMRPDGWEDEGNGFWKLTFQDYEAEENLGFRYYLLSLPATAADAERLLDALSRKEFHQEDLEDLRDILLEFNGTTTGNERIQEFLANQSWQDGVALTQIPQEVFNRIEARMDFED